MSARAFTPEPATLLHDRPPQQSKAGVSTDRMTLIATAREIYQSSGRKHATSKVGIAWN